jgi:hypothetical protein
MRRTLSAYQCVAPAVLAPLSYWLWLRALGGDVKLTLIVWGAPVLWAYLVPGIGTNVLKVWEFDVRLRLGRFRPHHGFVFGSATAMFAWAVHGTAARDAWDALRLALVLASVLGFWNLLYDIKALQSGILRVYNEPWARGAGPAEVALDYAPWFFAGFGAVYGLGIGLIDLHAAALQTWPRALGALGALVAVGAVLPTLGYMWRSMRLHGHPGTRPVARKEPSA